MAFNRVTKKNPLGAGRPRTYLKKPHTKLIKIPKETYKRIEKLAERSDMSVMEYIQQLMYEAVADKIVFEYEPEEV